MRHSRAVHCRVDHSPRAIKAKTTCRARARQQIGRGGLEVNMNPSSPDTDSVDRRQFLAAAAVAGVGLLTPAAHAQPTTASASTTPATGASAIGLPAPPLERVRIGIVGVGNRGAVLLGQFLKIDGCQVTAVCDVIPERADRARATAEAAGLPAPQVFAGDDRSYRGLCDRDDVDLIINATPWDWHVPIAVDALHAGKHVGVEVPAAFTLEECWQLVEACEKTRKHCTILENCCYGETELMVLEMVRAGLFGELTHGEAAYIHDLKAYRLESGSWRARYAREFNGNLYPTHGLGPLAQYMSINRGDRFDYLVSLSSPAIGLNAFARETFGVDDPRSKVQYASADMNTTLIKTARGRSIMLQYDTTTPRPYSRINLVSGTKGIFAGYPDRVSFGHSEWEPADTYREKYRHPLWTKLGTTAREVGGHGGMDYVMCWRLIDRLREGRPLDHDVYDAAAWSAVVELSIRSVSQRSAAMDFPDFTRGAWKERPAMQIGI